MRTSAGGEGPDAGDDEGDAVALEALPREELVALMDELEAERQQLCADDAAEGQRALRTFALDLYARAPAADRDDLGPIPPLHAMPPLRPAPPSDAPPLPRSPLPQSLSMCP